MAKASKNVHLSRITIRQQAFQRAIDEVCTLPLNPAKGGSKSEFVFFCTKINFCRINSATVFLCMKNFGGIVVV